MVKNLMKKLLIGSLFLSILPAMAMDQSDTRERPIYNEEEFQNYMLQKEAMKHAGLPEEMAEEVQTKGIEASGGFTFTCPSIEHIMNSNSGIIKHMGIDFEVIPIAQDDYTGINGIFFEKGNLVEFRYDDYMVIPKFKNPESFKCGYYSSDNKTFKTEALVSEYNGYELSNTPITCIRK